MYVAKGDKLVAVQVEVGASDGRRTEIKSGALTPGTQVVLDVAEGKP